MITGMEIVETAKMWHQTPFVHQGRVCGVGVDCAGLLIGVAHQLGLSEYDIDGYSRTPDGVTIRALLREHMTPVSMDEARPGDALLFGWTGVASHLGIITRVNPVYVIHAYEPSGQVVEHRIDSLWRRSTFQVYRFPGVVV